MNKLHFIKSCIEKIIKIGETIYSYFKKKKLQEEVRDIKEKPAIKSWSERFKK